MLYSVYCAVGLALYIARLLEGICPVQRIASVERLMRWQTSKKVALALMV